MLSGTQSFCLVFTCIPTIGVVGPLPSCVYISPPFPSTLAPASGSIPSSTIFTIFTPQSLSHTLPPLFSKPRALLQSESHNDLPSCPLSSPIPLDFAFVIQKLENKSVWFFVMPLLIFRSHSRILGLLSCFSFRSWRMQYTRRVFWNSFRLYFHTQTRSSFFVFPDGTDVYVRTLD